MKRIGYILLGLFFIQASCNKNVIPNQAKFTVKQQYAYLVENRIRTNSVNENYKPVNTVYFGYNEFILTEEARLKLQDFYTHEFLKNPSVAYYIEGNTDTSGSLDYNYELSRKRAIQVQNYLMSLGADTNNFSILAKGELNPVADDNTSPELNRRVTIYIKR